MRPLILALALVAIAPAAANAQFLGYGGMGYGGMGLGYGGMGYGGMGLGYGGMAGFGFGTAGVVPPGFGMGYGNVALPYAPSYGYGFGYANTPMFGVGLTPLGTSSALVESAIIRGSGGYRTRLPGQLMYAPTATPGTYQIYRP